MSRNKSELFAFSLALLGVILYVKTGSFLIFSAGILSAAYLVFFKNKFIK